MADFYKVHTPDLIERLQHARPFECFRLMLREPPPVPNNKKPVIVTLKALPKGHWEPAHKEDRRLIGDWKKRHKLTPDSRFRPNCGTQEK